MPNTKAIIYLNKFTIYSTGTTVYNSKVYKYISFNT